MGKKKGHHLKHRSESNTRLQNSNQPIKASSMLAMKEFFEGNTPQIPMRSLFPADFRFPPVESMSEKQITRKVDKIEDILFAHNIHLGFCEKTPDKLIYKYLITEVIPKEEIDEKVFEGCFTTFNGCTGWCEGCFQKDYCDNQADDC